jgi:hypothetical protein
MEAIKRITENLPVSTESRSTEALSTSTLPRQSLGVSREKINAMLAVLNKRWLTQGWRVMDTKDSEPMALAWIDILDAAGIPYRYYEDLYKRSLVLRSRRMEQGLECDSFSADMMVACWRAMSAELEQKLVEEHRYLPSTAASDCQRCFGSGMEVVPGKGARPCSHD